MPDLVPFICPVCVKEPESYYGHLQKPGTTGEYCPNHVTRDPDTGEITEEKIELVPVGHKVQFGTTILKGATILGVEVVDAE